MTDDERKSLAPGDKVRVRDDAGNEAEYAVKYAPWQLGHGQWVIGLVGIAGGYALERVVAKVPLLDADEFAWSEEGYRARKAAEEFSKDTQPPTPRCSRCGWPLQERIEDGCVEGNCSERGR